MERDENNPKRAQRLAVRREQGRVCVCVYDHTEWVDIKRRMRVLLAVYICTFSLSGARKVAGRVSQRDHKIMTLFHLA